MREHVRVAAVTLDSAVGDLTGNLARLEHWAHEAAAAGASLLLTPELSLTGVIPNHPTCDHAEWLQDALLAARQMAEPITGRALTRLQSIARDTGLLLAAGLLEDAGATLHDTHLLVGPEGLLGTWRKLHVPMFERPFHDGGNQARVVDTPLGRLGITICVDAFLPESVRLLAVQGAEIVLFPFAADPAPVGPEGWADWAGPVLQARCQENGVFGLACNVLGDVHLAGVSQSFGGGAAAIDPSGRLLARQEEACATPHLLLADFTRDAQIRARAAFEYTFRFRRPELYGPLAVP